MRRSCPLLAAALLTAGCGEVLLPDAGGLADASLMDAAGADAGLEDRDAGDIDDAGAPDAGQTDAGGVDARVDDGGGADSGVEPDAADAGAEIDAGPSTYRLSLVFDGDGAGEVRWPDSTSCTSDCARDLPTGARVDLLATPGPNSALDGWSLAACGASPTCEVPLDGDLIVRVRFEARYEVSVAPTGDGLGAIDGLGVLCAPSCTTRVTSGDTLTVTPRPATGSTFAGWTGPCAGQGTSCTLQITGPTTLSPTWDLELPQLTQAPGGHLCALLGPRSVRCWGNGLWGQLGRQSDASIGDDETVASQGDLPLGLDVVQVAAGGTSTCVLQRSGAVRCWGLNDHGQLGQGDTTPIGNAGGPAPANVADIDLGGPALQVVVGGWHACARMASGGVRCWGRGLEGQLGYGDTNNVADGSTAITSPALAGDVDLGPGPRVSFVAAGAYHTCVILEGGDVKCWGSNDGGELGYPFADRVGDGNAQRPLPRDVGALPLGATPVASIHLGTEMSCARFTGGAVKCWGRNVEGQLGTGDNVQVGGAAGRTLAMGASVALSGPADDLRVGADHVCAIVAGSVHCWGSGAHGKLGTGAPANLVTPSPALSLGSGRTAIVIGTSGPNTCAIQGVDAQPGTLEARCWGRGSTGGLGTGSTVNVGDQPGTMPPSPTPLF